MSTVMFRSFARHGDEWMWYGGGLLDSKQHSLSMGLQEGPFLWIKAYHVLVVATHIALASLFCCCV
jgi:hypothetical protein